MVDGDANRWLVPAPSAPFLPAASVVSPEPQAASGGSAVRDVGLVVRLSRVERAVWHAAARVEGRGKTAWWVRDVVAAHIEGCVAPERPDEGLERVRGELVRIGTNLNQVAYALNAVGFGGRVPELDRIREVLEATKRGLAEARDQLRDRGERGGRG